MELCVRVFQVLYLRARRYSFSRGPNYRMAATLVACIAVTASMLDASPQAAGVPGQLGSAPTREELAAVDEPTAIEPELVPELTTATSNTYQLPDGSRTLETYNTPVNFLDETGEWEQVDNNLVSAPDPHMLSRRR